MEICTIKQDTTCLYIKKKTKWLRGKKTKHGWANQTTENWKHPTDTGSSEVTEILKEQFEAYTLISQIQVRADNKNPEAVKIQVEFHSWRNWHVPGI